MLHNSHRRLALAVITLSAMAALPTAGQTLNEDFKLLPGDGAQDDEFGTSVAISGTTAVVGAPYHNDNDSNTGAAYLFDTTTGQQLFKLRPSDAGESDNLGWAVAMSGTTALVGAPRDRTNGVYIGSAYLFDTTTGQQLFKLLPNDATEFDRFGSSVAISGTTALVGNPQDRDNYPNWGSAYLFNTNTGEQLFKLLPSDGADYDGFGRSVAISGTTALVGAFWIGLDGSFSFSVYVFDTTNGQQIAKLQPSDGAAGDSFGYSVAISGTKALIGAPGDDDNGSSSGSAYLFDTSTGQQLMKLQPSDGAEFDAFGWSVALSGTKAVIGSNQDDANTADSGSAYLFDTTTGQQIAKLLPSDGATNDRFGHSVAFNGAVAVVGAYQNDDNGFDSGSAYLFDLYTDTDGDGLLDDWEINGIPYTDHNGQPQRYLLPDANPMRKDLYLELDSVQNYSLEPDALTRVIDAFADSPLTNPDGSMGVTLHIDATEANLTLPDPTPVDAKGWPTNHDTSRTAYFGSSSERASLDSVSRLAARAKAYRYCIVAVTHLPLKDGKLIPGIAQNQFDNLYLYWAHINPTRGSDGLGEYQAATLMHELGHCLGLTHGGCDDEYQGKTNQPSIMNYAFNYPYQWNADFWRLDYLRVGPEELGPLNENALNEAAGIGTADGEYRNVSMPFGVEFVENSIVNRRAAYARLNGTPVDFGSTGKLNGPDGEFSPSIVQDLNYITITTSVPNVVLPRQASAGQTFNICNEWEAIMLPTAAVRNLRGVPEYPDEPSTVDIQWIDENLPPPPPDCLADTNSDGILSPADFTAWIAAFNAQSPQCDQNDDGLCTPADFSAWIANYNAGCF